MARTIAPVVRERLRRGAVEPADMARDISMGGVDHRCRNEGCLLAILLGALSLGALHTTTVRAALAREPMNTADL